jgi:hypothetical protein
VSPVRRGSFAFFLAAATVLCVGAGGCTTSASSSSPPSTSSPPTTAPAASSAGPRDWLAGKAGRWNATLNGDQNSVDAAAATTSGVSSATYFSELSAACTRMLDDAGKARTIPGAPTVTLQDAWIGMLGATEAYANECIQVARSQSNADLTVWKNGLKSMNAANQTWNSEVGKVHHASASSSG